MDNGVTFLNGNKLNGLLFLKESKIPKFSKEKLSLEILLKATWGIATFWLHLPPWLNDQIVLRNYFCWMKWTSKNITLSKCFIKESGLLLIWISTFHFYMESQPLPKQKKVNYGLFCFKRHGPNFTVLTKEYKLATQKKGFMIWQEHQSDKLLFKVLLSIRKKNGNILLMQVKESIQWFHLPNQVLTLTSQFLVLYKVTLILS